MRSLSLIIRIIVIFLFIQSFNFELKAQKSISVKKQRKELNKILIKYPDSWNRVTEKMLCIDDVGQKLNYFKENDWHNLSDELDRLINKYPDWGDPYFLYAFIKTMRYSPLDRNDNHKAESLIEEMIPFFWKAFDLGIDNEDIIKYFMIPTTGFGHRDYLNIWEYYLRRCYNLYFRDNSKMDIQVDKKFWNKTMAIINKSSISTYSKVLKSYYLNNKMDIAIENNDSKMVEHLLIEASKNYNNCVNYANAKVISKGEDYNGTSFISTIEEFPIEFASSNFNEVYNRVTNTLESLSEDELLAIKKKTRDLELKVDKREYDYSLDSDDIGMPLVLDRGRTKKVVKFTFNINDFVFIKLYQSDCKIYETYQKRTRFVETYGTIEYLNQSDHYECNGITYNDTKELSELLSTYLGVSINTHGSAQQGEMFDKVWDYYRIDRKIISDSPPVSSQNSSDKCLKQAFISIEIEGVMENKRKLVISGNGSTFSNVSDDNVEILNYVTDCVAGDYNFKYTYNMGQSNQKTINGSFSIDGKNDSYEIAVDAFGGISIKNL